MTASGLISSRSLPSSRMAAISASNCSVSSLGGQVKSCGACTVATATTISPMCYPLQHPPFGLPRFIDVLDAELLQLRAETVKIETQLALRAASREFSLLWRCAAWPALATSAASSRGTTTTPSTSADDDVARIHAALRAHHRNIDRARCRFHRALRGNGFRPNRKIHRGQFGGIAHAGVDDQTRPRRAPGRKYASRSPNMPSVDSEVVVTTRTSPGLQTSIDAWIIRLSPGWHGYRDGRTRHLAPRGKSAACTASSSPFGPALHGRSRRPTHRAP